jgi:predicted ATPase
VITKLSIGHFKAVASATVPLGPITVLVGPNDSGKSTILQALMALSRCADRARFGASDVLECSTSVASTNGDTSTNMEFMVEGLATAAAIEKQQPYRYTTRLSARGNVFAGEEIQWAGKPMLTAVLGGPRVVHTTSQRIEGWTGTSTELSVFANEPSSNRDASTKPIFEAIATDLGATLVRLDARAISRPSPLGAPLAPDGSGLVGIVDELLTSGIGEDQVSHVNEMIRKLSPHVKSVAARLHAGGGKELHFALRSGAVIPASQMSDGIVLAAALVLISLRSGSRRLLIEEPENGLHPRQLKVVADTIRTIAETQGTQIVLTTHSPLLLNHFGAEEVLLVTRDESGVRTQRMSDAKGLEDLASEMALGELWYNVGDSNLARPA